MLAHSKWLGTSNRQTTLKDHTSLPKRPSCKVEIVPPSGVDSSFWHVETLPRTQARSRSLMIWRLASSKGQFPGPVGAYVPMRGIAPRQGWKRFYVHDDYSPEHS